MPHESAFVCISQKYRIIINNTLSTVVKLQPTHLYKKNSQYFDGMASNK